MWALKTGCVCGSEGVSVWVAAHVCRYLWRTDENIYTLEMELKTGSLSSVDAGTKHSSFGKALALALLSHLSSPTSHFKIEVILSYLNLSSKFLISIQQKIVWRLLELTCMTSYRLNVIYKREDI